MSNDVHRDTVVAIAFACFVAAVAVCCCCWWCIGVQRRRRGKQDERKQDENKQDKGKQDKGKLVALGTRPQSARVFDTRAPALYGLRHASLREYACTRLDDSTSSNDGDSDAAGEIRAARSTTTSTALYDSSVQYL